MAKVGLNQVNIAYNGYKIGKKYDQLVDDPFQGNGTDVVARMKNHNGEPVVLQRGINRALNAGTLGVYGAAVDAVFDGAYTNQQRNIQNQAEQEGLGKVNKLANKAIEAGTQLIVAKLLGL